MKTLLLSLSAFALANIVIVSANPVPPIVTKPEIPNLKVLCIYPETGRFVINNGKPAFLLLGCNGKVNQWTPDASIFKQKKVLPYNPEDSIQVKLTSKS